MSSRKLYTTILAALFAYLAYKTALEVYSSGSGTCGSLLRPMIADGVSDPYIGWFWNSDKYCSASMSARWWTMMTSFVIWAILMIQLARWSNKSEFKRDRVAENIGS